jgi:hypothetical protein
MESKRFRIAFSFAGEKRDFVAQVAAILARRFGEDKILYDKFHQPEFSRSDLAFSAARSPPQRAGAALPRLRSGSPDSRGMRKLSLLV